MKRARRGQVLLYFLGIIVAVALLAVMNAESFLAVRAKFRMMNAADSAALAAARCQGELINRIGELNLAHIKAAAEGDDAEAQRIILEQRRLALLGPIGAIAGSSDAARRNHAPDIPAAASLLADHAARVRNLYSSSASAADAAYPESYPGAWAQYSAALSAAAASGIAAAPDNIEFFDSTSGHVLLRKDFYQAIASEDWCWFYFNDLALLNSYSSYRDFAPLTPPAAADTVNSEIYSLHLVARNVALAEVFTQEEIAILMRRAGVKALPGNLFEPPFAKVSTWFFFDHAAWGDWLGGEAEYDAGDLGLVGGVRPLYNVRGAAAICRVIDRKKQTTAAAKPFGSIEALDSSGDACVTAAHYFVLPCMSDVRLVPTDSVGGRDLATGDCDWIIHIREHLPSYLERGAAVAAGNIMCWYCRQLVRWERRSFHSIGTLWLKHHSAECIRPLPGRPYSTGGTPHGH